MIPEALQKELRSLLEDIRLFQGKEAPKELVLTLATYGSRVEPYDKDFSNRLLIYFMALIPRQEGEPPFPEGWDLFLDFISQDLIHKLGGPCPVPPSLPPSTRTSSPAST